VGTTDVERGGYEHRFAVTASAVRRTVAAIAEIAKSLGHAPLVDVRPDTVTVQVITPG
jgi:pterin-4a-carbinolamine dehydratase